MDPQMTSSKETLWPEHKWQTFKIMVGSAKKFKGVPVLGDYNSRSLTMNAWSQTHDQSFLILNSNNFGDMQSEREKELEAHKKVLEENLRVHSELLSKISATLALLSHNTTQTQLSPKNGLMESHGNFFNSPSDNSSFNSPMIVNAMNSTQQVSSSPTESVKYKIIAEGAGNSIEEPIEIQLAEDDGALNLNSSADSGRLEICLDTKENMQIKTECSTGPTQESTPLNSPCTTIPNSEQTVSKKRRLATSTRNDSEQYVPLLNNIPQQPPIENCHYSSDGLTTTSKKQNKNVNNSTDTLLGPTNGSNFSPQCEAGIDKENAMVSIGPNNTRIPAKLYESISWTSASIATRKLLRAVFDRHVLATHSMTGKPSPAFKDHDKPVKQMLDPLIIADIIHTVTSKCNVPEKDVRSAITTKCSDENKMLKLQMNRQTAMREEDKENLVQ